MIDAARLSRAAKRYITAEAVWENSVNDPVLETELMLSFDELRAAIRGCER